MKKFPPGEGKADLTTVALRRKTRDRLDSLGYDRHASYDLIINSLLDQQKEWKSSSEIFKQLSQEIHEIHSCVIGSEAYNRIRKTQSRRAAIEALIKPAEIKLAEEKNMINIKEK
jgi:hypothetical protein